MSALAVTADPAMADALAAFRRAYPAYDSTSRLDELRTTEYARLDECDQVYLDYTGGGLYAESQLRDHMALLSHNVFGNPHSTNPTSQAMTHLVERARRHVLDHFHAAPDEYVAIFTPNASGALKLVGEAYPFAAGDHYLLTADSHNSVNGIREFAQAAGATVTYVPVVAPALRVDEGVLRAHLGRAEPGRNHLFAYPAQSNFSGVQHPLEWIALAQGWSRKEPEHPSRLGRPGDQFRRRLPLRAVRAELPEHRRGRSRDERTGSRSDARGQLAPHHTRGRRIMRVTFGEIIQAHAVDGRALRAAVFNEHEVRAAAGVTMALGAVAFVSASFAQQYVPIKIVTAFFFFELLIRVSVGLTYSPIGIVSRWLMHRQEPLWVSRSPGGSPGRSA